MKYQATTSACAYTTFKAQFMKYKPDAELMSFPNKTYLVQQGFNDSNCFYFTATAIKNYSKLLPNSECMP